MTDQTDKINRLLEQLSTDDAFREKVLGDPVAAFAEHGIEIDPAQVPAVRRLPSKQALAAEREKIRHGLTDQALLVIFCAQDR